MSYRLINANALAISYKEVNDMPCIYADLPNGLDGGYYDVTERGSYDQYPEQGEREDGGECESYDAGFSNGVKACLQQLDGLIHEGANVDEIQGWIDRQWEEEVE